MFKYYNTAKKFCRILLSYNLQSKFYISLYFEVPDSADN